MLSAFQYYDFIRLPKLEALTTARLASCTVLGHLLIWYLRIVGTVSVLPFTCDGLRWSNN